jgi:hypothetical protein
MATPIQDSMKTCTQCELEKPLEDFYKASTARPTKDGRHAECKECWKRRTKERKDGFTQEQKDREKRLVNVRRQRLKDAVFAAYGGYRCSCCGETEPRFLTIDHINNDGGKFRKEVLGKRNHCGYHTYRWLARHGFPDGVQVLCMNCNHGRQMNGGICPHRLRSNDQSKDVEPSGSKREAPTVKLKLVG